MGNAFLICFNSLHFPCVDSNESSWENVCDDSKNLLIDFYQDLKHRMISTNYVGVTSEQLDGSLFGICITEGYVMLKCSTDLTKRSVSLNGFLLRFDESLRTAWMMTRWQLLFICSEGWKWNGKVWLSPDEIIKMADEIKLPERKQEQIVELAKKMLQTSIPFNFALTDYMKTRLPLIFDNGGGKQLDFDTSPVGDSIVINQSAVESMRRNLSMKSLDTDCILIRCSSKTFVSYKLSEAQSTKEKNEIKETYKTLLKNVKSVWCIRVFRGEKSFTECLPEYYAKEFDTNCVNYNIVDYLFTLVRKSADQFFTSLTENESAQEEKKSIFSKLRKNDAR